MQGGLGVEEIVPFCGGGRVKECQEPFPECCDMVLRTTGP